MGYSQTKSTVILKDFQVRAAASPGDELCSVIRGVQLVGGTATITHKLHARNGLRVSYLIAKEASFNENGDLTVDITPIADDDIVTVITYVDAGEGHY